MADTPPPASDPDHRPRDEGPTLEINDSVAATVGATTVRRALPHRPRRTVGAWCFVDHMGPATVDRPDQVGIGPHPHIGLQTVTWLLDGELRHRDTLGSDQVIRPGQLNLMTAGHGVAHAEEATAYLGAFHGLQLWVAQPEATRHDAPAFEHHGELPALELDGGEGRVLVGEAGGVRSTARADTDHLGVDLDLRSGTSVLALRPDHEHALLVVEGAIRIDGRAVAPDRLAYLGLGRDQVAITATEPTRALLIGGSPFEARVAMWWNFVGRAHDELAEAGRDWNADDRDRFGDTGSTMTRIPAPDPPWG